MKLSSTGKENFNDVSFAVSVKNMDCKTDVDFTFAVAVDVFAVDVTQRENPFCHIKTLTLPREQKSGQKSRPHSDQYKER